MFTAEQIITAHSKVKSGADFPSYIIEIKNLGVTSYESFVSNGHINYYGINNYKVKVLEKYEPLEVTENTNIEKFKYELISHQKGKTDYYTFIKMCAETGIEKWEICIDKMTCTYFNKKGVQILVENIPQ